MKPADLRMLTRSVLISATVTADCIKLKLAKPKLAEILGIREPNLLPPDECDDSAVHLLVRGQLKRVGGESKLIVHGRNHDPPANRQVPALIEAVVQAHAWNKAALADPDLTLSQITVETGKSDRYISGVMRLAYLVPDITLAIIDGTQPRSLSLRKLLTGVPLAWSEQQEAFGFQNP